MKPFEIDFQVLPEGVTGLDRELSRVDLGLEAGRGGEGILLEDLEVLGPAAVTVRISKGPSEILLTGVVGAKLRAPCARCLGPAEEEIQADISLVLHRAAAGSPGQAVEGEGDEEDAVRVLPPHTSRVDIAEDIRAAFILALPIRFICREDCRGLCPRCGKNLNEGDCGCPGDTGDSRWQALRSLEPDRS